MERFKSGDFDRDRRRLTAPSILLPDINLPISGALGLSIALQEPHMRERRKNRWEEICRIEQNGKVVGGQNGVKLAKTCCRRASIELQPWDP